MFRNALSRYTSSALRAPSPQRGRQRRNRAARLANKQVLPRTRKLFPLCTISLWVTAPGLPVLRGVSGGGATLSSLCRRFPGGDIMNLTSRRSPLSGLSFSLFFFLLERKRGYWRLRSYKISVGKTKPDSEPSPLRGRQSRVVPHGSQNNTFRPNTETFSAVHNISVSYRSRLARSPGGLGGRSRIEPRILISSLFAGANRGSLRGAVP